MHQNALAMAVKRIDVLHDPAFTIAVADNDHVSPAHVTIAGEHDDALADTKNRITEIRVAATDSIPVFAHMAVRAEPARLVISLRLRFTDREIETVRQSHEGG